MQIVSCNGVAVRDQNEFCVIYLQNLAFVDNNFTGICDKLLSKFYLRLEIGKWPWRSLKVIGISAIQ